MAHYKVVATKASSRIRDLSRHVSLYLIGYNPVVTEKMLSQHTLALKAKKLVAALFLLPFT